MFKDGNNKQWIKWRIQLHELICDIPLQTEEAMIKTAKALLKGTACKASVTKLVKAELNAKSKRTSKEDHVVFLETIDHRGRCYFTSQHAYCCQWNYLRYRIYILDMRYCDFKAQLLRQTNHLMYFPIPDDHP